LGVDLVPVERPDAGAPRGNLDLRALHFLQRRCCLRCAGVYRSRGRHVAVTWQSRGSHVALIERPDARAARGNLDLRALHFLQRRCCLYQKTSE